MDAVLEWIRHRILGVALSAASFITLVSLIAPAWLDFLLDLSMVGLIAIVAKLARPRSAVPIPRAAPSPNARR